MQGLVLEDESSGVGESESVFSFSEKWKCFFFRKEAISLSLSGSLSLAPSWPGRRLTLTFFLSWTSCFHQNKILIEELNLSFLSRNNGGGSGWFGDRYENIDLVQAEEMVYLCSRFVRHCIIIISSQRGTCYILQNPGCFGKMIFCALVVLRESDVVWCVAKKGCTMHRSIHTSFLSRLVQYLQKHFGGNLEDIFRVSVLLHWLGQQLSKYWVWETEPFKLVLLDCFGNFWVHGGKNWVLFCKFRIKIGRLLPVFKFRLEGRFYFSLF